MLHAPATKLPLKTKSCTSICDTLEGRSLLCMPDVWFGDDAFEQLLNYVNSSKGAYAPNTERARLMERMVLVGYILF